MRMSWRGFESGAGGNLAGVCGLIEGPDRVYELGGAWFEESRL